MRVDEEIKDWSILAIRAKAHAVVGRGEKSLCLVAPNLSDDQGGRRKTKCAKIVYKDVG